MNEKNKNGCSVLNSEVKNNIKGRKATSENVIIVTQRKEVGKYGMRKLIQNNNVIYETEEQPKDFLGVTMIAL